MTALLRKPLMASAAALILVAAPVFQPADLAFSSLAHARGGSDDSGGDDHGGRSGGDRSSDDHGGRSGRDSSDDDSSHRGGSDDDDHGRGHDDAADNDRDDDDNRRGRDGRPETVLSVSDESLSGLLNGSLVAVDQLGRRLEIEVELEHGQRIVKAEVHRSDARRTPGPITSGTVTTP